MAPPPTPSRRELDKAHREFRAAEPSRAFVYGASLALIELADSRRSDVTLAEALALLLLVWNMTYYRMKPDARDNLLSDLDRLLGGQENQLAAYRRRTIESLDDSECPSVMALFDRFQLVLGPVGAAKALHLLAPRFFPLWDTEIRRSYSKLGYKVNSNKPERRPANYWDFMQQVTRVQVVAVGGASALGRNPLKAIDEWNYVDFTVAARERRNTRRSRPQPARAAH
jgi:hypothetical protein